MIETVEIPIAIDAGAAAALADVRTRAAMGRLISRVLRPRQGSSEFARAIVEEARVEAQDTGLTDAHDAERAVRPITASSAHAAR